jgi:hypothetical protein
LQFRGFSMNSPVLTILMYMGFMALFGLVASQNRGYKVSKVQDCRASFEALGVSRDEYKRASDTEVFKTCGFRPELPINTVWQENRPNKHSPESMEELTACENNFALAGYSPNEFLKVADSELIKVCGFIPLYFDD